MERKKVIIFGLGALGLTYANKLKVKCEIKILADEFRIKNYIKNPPIFNNKKQSFDYITPKDNFEADLIIITTKSNGLNAAIESIKNFVGKNTIIISLINGISSEDLISKTYSNSVVRSFFIGHSAMCEKINNKKLYRQDGIGKIVIEKHSALEELFKEFCIDYEIADNIIYSQWVKLGVNIVLNQLTALHELLVGELRKKEDYQTIANNLLDEVEKIAFAANIGNLKNFKKDIFDAINLIADDGKTSMYQDIKSKTKTEVEIFSGEIIKLGKKYHIETPINQEIYEKIREKEESYT